MFRRREPEENPYLSRKIEGIEIPTSDIEDIKAFVMQEFNGIVGWLPHVLDHLLKEEWKPFAAEMTEVQQQINGVMHAVIRRLLVTETNDDGSFVVVFPDLTEDL